jgi:ankyrin repeat protein
LFEYVARRLEADPALAAAPHSGTRTLLHAAAGAWNVPFVELLLQLGADPNALDAAGHAPLYAAGNRLVRPERRHSDAGSRVVAALVEAGADVNACDGAKRCTALHMAARRGNVAIAAALLDHHADIEACDSLGETPLRRAVNCGQPAMVALLLSRGADAHAKGSRGLTPLQAARTPAIKALFRRHTAGS